MDFIKTPKVENVRVLDRYNNKQQLVGTLYLTATHLIFVGPDSKKETWILHSHIASVDKLPISTVGSALQVRCKTFLSMTFILSKERECQEVFATLSQLCRPVHIEDLYCFHYTSSGEDLPKQAGWNFFDLQNEFQRMRVPNENWSLTLLNQNYELCDTYPKFLYVPSSATSQTLIGSARFRSKGRLPVLTYLHENKAAICRCSQPLSGFKARCFEDERMLEAVLKSTPGASYMFVVDTRPRINAMANRATGKGYENENFYENIKFHFFGIENIHVMRSSLLKLVETCELSSPSMNEFLSGIESSGWLKHIRTIIDTSQFIAQAVQSGVSVVVHCSDGWDRTAQVCALSTLMLDPHCRTIQGYQALIEKDWLGFGHKFSDRIGHIAGDSREVSPVFTQFIDATWQLMCQHPKEFQFNENFLLTIHDHVSSCQYGTFIGNCEKDRMDLRLNERTFSLWGFMANHTNEYVNPLYCDGGKKEVLEYHGGSQGIKFWPGMYCRFESGVHPRENISESVLAMHHHSSLLKDHISHLKSRISSLTSLLYRPDKDNISEKLNELTIDKTSLTRRQLKLETDSVAVDWKPLQSVSECSCGAPFDLPSEKHHCWRCGNIFCTRCMDKMIVLPGSIKSGPCPVCRLCWAVVQRPDESP